MAIWQFFDYVSAAGNNLIQEWIEGLSVDEESDLNVLLDAMGKQKLWVWPDYKTLSKGLGELRWKGDQQVPMRLVGFRDPNPAALKFTFLIGCTHKQNIYDPPKALEQALKRKKHLDNCTATTCEHGHETD